MTGAASGLGRATAERFVREGAKVVVCDLPKSAGQEVADQLGSDAVFAPTDVRDLSMCSVLFENTVQMVLSQHYHKREKCLAK